MDLKSKIILIYGPTASGKSDFAIKLAKKINGEIINADSMQVYKDLKILTARPLKRNYKNIKHHLYGFHNGKKIFSTGNWLKLAVKKIYEIKGRKKINWYGNGNLDMIANPALGIDIFANYLFDVEQISQHLKNNHCFD